MRERLLSQLTRVRAPAPNWPLFWQILRFSGKVSLSMRCNCDTQRQCLSCFRRLLVQLNSGQAQKTEDTGPGKPPTTEGLTQHGLLKLGPTNDYPDNSENEINDNVHHSNIYNTKQSRTAHRPAVPLPGCVQTERVPKSTHRPRGAHTFSTHRSQSSSVGGTMSTSRS